jgi:hypothetical protein
MTRMTRFDKISKDPKFEKKWFNIDEILQRNVCWQPKRYPPTFPLFVKFRNSKIQNTSILLRNVMENGHVTPLLKILQNRKLIQ